MRLAGGIFPRLLVLFPFFTLLRVDFSFSGFVLPAHAWVLLFVLLIFILDYRPGLSWLESQSFKWSFLIPMLVFCVAGGLYFSSWTLLFPVIYFFMVRYAYREKDSLVYLGVLAAVFTQVLYAFFVSDGVQLFDYRLVFESWHLLGMLVALAALIFMALQWLRESRHPKFLAALALILLTILLGLQPDEVQSSYAFWSLLAILL